MGTSGYRPFDSDSAHDWFALKIDTALTAPIRKAANGDRGAYEEAYAAIWVALGIERQEARLFHDEVLPHAKPMRRRHRLSKARRVPATIGFWKTARKALNRMRSDGSVEDWSHPAALAAGYRRLLADVRAVLRAHQADDLARRAEEIRSASFAAPPPPPAPPVVAMPFVPTVLGDGLDRVIAKRATKKKKPAGKKSPVTTLRRTKTR
jgi:hypothetical protein